MPVYAYRALSTDGAILFGQVEANGRQDAIANLCSRGLQPLDLSETAGKQSDAGLFTGFSLQKFRSGSSMSPRVLETSTRQLASLLAAGVPLAQALHLLSTEADEQGRKCWSDVHDAVLDGSSLAQAMESQPTIFPKVYTAMVRAGETGGFLDLVLRQIAAFQNRDRDLRSKVQGAMIYPAVLAGLSVCVVTFLMVFFIPRFQTMFSDFGAALPPLTRAIVGTSLVLKQYGIYLLIGLVLLVIWGKRSLATSQGKQWLETRILKLPIIGTVSARFAMTRFCRMLGTLTHAGVPLIHALKVARESIGHETLALAVDQAISQVQHGERLGTSLAACRQLFPSSVIAMITVAERSGRLGEELIRLSEDAENDLDHRLRQAVALAEPAMLFVMAAVVGLIVIGMVLPIFAIQDYIN